MTKGNFGNCLSGVNLITSSPSSVLLAEEAEVEDVPSAGFQKLVRTKEEVVQPF